MTILFLLLLFALIGLSFFIGYFVGKRKGIIEQYEVSSKEFRDYHQEVMNILKDPFQKYLEQKGKENN